MKNLLFLGLILLSPLSMAGEVNGADTAWVLTATALVLMMTLPGLALFYGGLVRSKNVLSILAQCFSVAAVVSILWFSVGYSLAFTDGNGFIGDLSKAFLIGIDKSSVSGSIPEILFVMFQMTFAIITPALIIGGFAERIKFGSMLLFSAIWLLTVYVPVAHWVWGGGWLAQMGVLDFAGGLVVHITAGVAALVAALVIGHRKGFTKQPLTPHNLTMAVTGAGLLWVGWFGFNGGSALTAGADAATAIVATHLSASMGVIVWAGLEWAKYGRPTLLGMITGMVAGLGSVTPAAGFVSPAGALVIGFLAGSGCFYFTTYFKQVLKIDDSLDVFPVHGLGGIFGTLLVGILASGSLGWFSGYGSTYDISSIGNQLYVQAVAVIAVVTYTAIVTWVILRVIDALIGLRPDAEEEEDGLDIVYHEERGYDL